MEGIAFVHTSIKQGYMMRVKLLTTEMYYFDKMFRKHKAQAAPRGWRAAERCSHEAKALPAARGYEGRQCSLMRKSPGEGGWHPALNKREHTYTQKAHSIRDIHFGLKLDDKHAYMTQDNA